MRSYSVNEPQNSIVVAINRCIYFLIAAYWYCVDFCKIFTFTGSLKKDVGDIVSSILDYFVTTFECRILKIISVGL